MKKVETVESCSADITLAVIILYLQDHVQKSSDTLPSVVMAISLLVLGSSSKQGRLGLCCVMLIMKSFMNLN